MFEIERISSEKEEEKSCVIALCLAKNNPMLQEEEFAQQVLKTVSSQRHTTILVCDSINVWERLLSNGTTHKQAHKLANLEGDRIQKHFQNMIDTKKLKNVRIVRWKEIENELYQKHLFNLRQAILENTVLAQELEKCAKFYIHRRNPDVTINAKRVNYFSEYIIREMVVQLYGVQLTQLTDGNKTHTMNLLFHPIYIDSYTTKDQYRSPILDLKSSFAKYLKLSKANRAYTSRIYLEKPNHI